MYDVETTDDLLNSRIYRDEPILRDALATASLVPPQYRRMREIVRNDALYGRSEAEIFYRQGKFMEDFEDDFDDDFLIEEGPEEPFQEQVAEEILADHLSVRETEKLVKELQEGRKKTKSVKKERTEDIYLAELARLLESSLHTKVQIRQGSKGRGRIEIEYYSNEDLEKLMDRLRQ